VAGTALKGGWQKPYLNERLLFVLVLLVSTAVRIALSVFPKIVTTYPDEAISLELARNIRLYGSLSVNGAGNTFPGVLYSLLAAPFFGIADTAVRFSALSAFNALLMSSSLVPAWLLCREILDRPALRIAALILLAVSPVLWLSAAFMAECLFIPLAVWAVWFLYRAFRDGTPGLKSSAGLGLWMYLAFLTSRAGYALIIGALALFVREVFAGRDKRKAGLSLLCFAGAFALCYAAGMFLLFCGQPCCYGLAWPDSPQKLLYLLTAAAVILLHFAAGTLLFPVLVPAAFGKHQEEPLKKMILLACAWAVAGAFVSAGAYALPESFGSLDMRVVLRVLAPAGWIFVLLFIAAQEKDPARSTGVLRRAVCAVPVLIALGLVLLRLPNVGYLTDAPSLAAAGLAADSSLLRNLIRFGLPVLFLLGAVCLWKEKRRILTLGTAAFLLAVGILNGAVLLNRTGKEAALPSEAARDQMRTLDGYLEAQGGSVLLVRTDTPDETERLIDTYCDAQYRSMKITELARLAAGAEKTGVIHLKDVPLLADGIDCVLYSQGLRLFDPERETVLVPEGVPCVRAVRNGDPAVLDVTDLYSCRPGERIRFTLEAPDYLRFAPKGFSHTEDLYTWTEGMEASLTLKVKRVEPKPLYFCFETQMTCGKQPCRVYADGILIGEETLSEGGETWLRIPDKLAGKDGPITFRFEFPDAREPGNGDPRLLGAAFTCIYLQEQ